MSEADRIQGYRPEDVCEGERYMQSPVTGDWYRVTQWVEKPDGKAIAISKEQVDEDDIPDEAIEESQN